MLQVLLLLAAAAVVSGRLDASREDVATATRYFRTIAVSCGLG